MVEGIGILVYIIYITIRYTIILSNYYTSSVIYRYDIYTNRYTDMISILIVYRLSCI